MLNFCAMSRAQLQVLLLVLADRHVRRAIDQDVGRHQVRIGVEPDRGVLAVLAGLLLELGHAVEPAEPRHAVEHPGELGVLGDLALVEHDVLLRIDAAGDERRGHLADRLGQLVRVLPHRDGVQVDHAIDAVVAVLQLDELDDGAEVIAEVQVAGRLHPGEHLFLERRFAARRSVLRATFHMARRCKSPACCAGATISTTGGSDASRSVRGRSAATASRRRGS